MKKYADHVAQIAAANHVFVEAKPDTYPVCYRPIKICINPIIDEVTYAVALHELGHALDERYPPDRISRERVAWEWAEKHALEWTPAMEAFRQHALQLWEETV